MFTERENWSAFKERIFRLGSCGVHEDFGNTDLLNFEPTAWRGEIAGTSLHGSEHCSIGNYRRSDGRPADVVLHAAWRRDVEFAGDHRVPKQACCYVRSKSRAAWPERYCRFDLS